jgi:hypothetical protein
VAALRAEVVLVLAVPAPARSQGLGGRAVIYSCGLALQRIPWQKLLCVVACANQSRQWWLT